ncbi:MAG: LapA family protein [Robiginitomaculum sp.]|nr:LapA family protein [Robiginitomaculum sp.]
MKKLWHWFKTTGLGLLTRFLAPWTSFIALISGALITYDFTSLRIDYPNWPGLFDVLDSKALIIIFLISATLAALLAWVMKRRQKSLNDLQKEIESTRDQIGEIGNNIKFLFDGLLLNLSKKLNFKQGDQARISIYVHENSDGHFIPCGRYSPNPELRKPGRTLYPDNQGCIAKGWQNGWHFDKDFPETSSRHKSYCQSQYDIPKNTHDGMKMRSRVYAALRLDDLSGNPLAVMVIESKNSEQFDANQLQTDLESIAVDFSQMISTLRQHIPSPSDATERGL